MDAKPGLNIRTKCIFDKVEILDGYRILVSRYRPREGERISEWLPHLGPSRVLLGQWKDLQSKISWENYVDQYLEQMKDQSDELSRLAGMARHGTITLLCFEREDNPYCHRHLLRKLIEEREEETASHGC